jgi:hypothetical protein
MKESRRRFFKKLTGMVGAAGAVVLSRSTVAQAANVWQGGDDRITYDDNDKTFGFVIDGDTSVEISEDNGSGVLAMRGHGTIVSNGDLRIHLDENEVTSPTNASLKVINGHDYTVFTVNEFGEADINQGGITTRTVPLAGATGTDEILNVGISLPGGHRGRVAIRNQPETSQEFYQPRKAGILVLYDEGGRENFLWVDSNGKLRISRTDPGDNDLSGTIVGSQS